MYRQKPGKMRKWGDVLATAEARVAARQKAAATVANYRMGAVREAEEQLARAQAAFKASKQTLRHVCRAMY